MKASLQLEKCRRSIRLPHYDYGQIGGYFITICTHHRQCLFGKIMDGKMELNNWGSIAEQCWNELPLHFDGAALGHYVIMPNHLHSILYIESARHYIHPDYYQAGQIQSQSLAAMIRSFKSAATRKIRLVIGNKTQEIWQRNYYEHVIRNDRDLRALEEYIEHNPMKWELDSLHPNKECSLS